MPTVATATQATPTSMNDNDGDDDNEKDDGNWGQAATAGDRRAITTLVRRYYAAVARGDGKTACSLLYSRFAERVPRFYGGPGRAPTLHACAEVMSRDVLPKVLKQVRQQLIANGSTLKVSGVRVANQIGLVLLRFKGAPEREFHVHRERNSWKIEELLDNALG
jgi:hypothetical protein